MIAYLYEHEKNVLNITKEAKENSIYLRIRCGEFSYAELAK
jgi:hypothetical protein